MDVQDTFLMHLSRSRHYKMISPWTMKGLTCGLVAWALILCGKFFLQYRMDWSYTWHWLKPWIQCTLSTAISFGRLKNWLLLDRVVLESIYGTHIHFQFLLSKGLLQRYLSHLVTVLVLTYNMLTVSHTCNMSYLHNERV